MVARVSSIHIEGFRGATTPVDVKFDNSKRVTLVFGENGTGKSTIADAFDLVCNGKCGSIEDYSLGGSARKFVPAVGCTAAQVKVALTCSEGGSWTASLDSGGPVVQPAVGCPDARILRRRHVLKLIEAQPKQRYEELKSFLAVPNIDKCESALRDAANTRQTSSDEAVRALLQANEALERLWVAEGRPGPNASEWATKESSKDVSALRSRLHDTTSLERACQDVEDILTRLDRSLDARTHAAASVSAAEARQKAGESYLAGQSAQLLTLLQRASDYVSQRGDELTHCPVCEQTIDPHELARALAERIARMHELSSLVSEVERARHDLIEKDSLAEEARRDFGRMSRILAARLVSSFLVGLAAIKSEISQLDELSSAAEPSESTEQQARRLWSLVAPIRVDLRRQSDADQKSLIQHNAIKTQADTAIEKTGVAQSQQILLNRLKQALDIVSTERKNYVEAVLDDIGLEVEALYARVHPGEGIGRVRFFLKPHAIGSLDFDAGFHDLTHIPPQAYYSESHLDTLGICVFLALAKRFKTERTILILDDVLTSADGPHLDRFMSLLHDESQYFSQVVVTTHYRLWRDHYRWAKGPLASTQVIELGAWTLETGLTTGDFETAIGELSGVAGRPQLDRQAVASRSGIVLELLLDFLTLKYRCRMPRMAQREYTLGDLAGGIDSKLAKELRTRKPPAPGQPKVDTSLRDSIDRATSYQWVRNSVGCHFSNVGSEVPDAEVRSMCQAVVALAAQLVCSFCGTLPTRRPSGSNWQCRCGELELYPLVYPGADPGTVDDEA